MTNPKSNNDRKRGAQPGNQNALKHGFYSSAFELAEHELLSTHADDDFSSEECLIRVLIKRTTDNLPTAGDQPLDENLSTLRTISFAALVLERLKRSSRFAMSRSALHSNNQKEE